MFFIWQILILNVNILGDVKEAAFIIPILKFDGSNTPITTLSNNGFTSIMSDRKLICTSDGKAASLDDTCVNRTGIYDRVKIPFNSSKITVVLETSNI